jgi:hypothetical protein
MTSQGSSVEGAAGNSATAAPSAAARPENSVLAYISTAGGFYFFKFKIE